MRCLLDAASRLALAMTANRSPIWDFLAKIRAALSCSHFCPGSDPCQQPPDDGCMLPPPQGNPCAKDLLSTLPLKEHCWISKTEEHSSRREIVSPFSSCMSRPGKAWALHQYQRQFDAETGAESNRPTVQTRVIRKVCGNTSLMPEVLGVAGDCFPASCTGIHRPSPKETWGRPTVRVGHPGWQICRLMMTDNSYQGGRQACLKGECNLERSKQKVNRLVHKTATHSHPSHPLSRALLLTSFFPHFSTSTHPSWKGC